MLSKEFLTKQIPPLKPTDSGGFALAQMEEFKLKHLPVVSEEHYVCLLAEKDIFLMGNPEESVDHCTMYAPCVRENASILEVLHVMGRQQLSLIPVLSNTNEYLGVITQTLLISKLAEVSRVASRGALFVLETSPDYSLSQITHLIEANNAKVLSFFSYPVEATSKEMLLIKIDLEDAAPVLRSLERFNYTVSYCIQEQGMEDETMKNRLDELMYYLEM